MAPRKSFSEQLTELDQLIIDRKVHLSYLENRAEIWREAGRRRPALEASIMSTTTALHRLERKYAEMVQRQH